jgi:signal transduction histidine kinase
MSRNAKFFITVVATAGLLAAAVTLTQAEWRSEQKLQFFLYVVLAVLSSRMKVGLPGVTGTLSVNFVFILLSAVELPRVDTLLISCAATLAQSLWSARTRPGLIKIAFNLGNAALCGVICSIVYGSLAIRTINSSLPVLLFCASVSYFVVNTLIVAEIIALTEMKRTVQVWRENFLWTAPQYIFGAGLVGVIHICNRHFGWEYAILVFPGIYLLDRSYRVYLSRLQEEKEHVKDKDEAYAQLAEAQQGLIALSRQAGMAEVASGVLHNVGNVLNSVNVSVTLVANKIRESRITNLVALSDLLKEHSGDLPDFLNSDPKGQRVLPYLEKLVNCLREEHQMMLREVESLTRHIDHIKEIVAAQQNYGKVFGLIDVVSLSELVEDAIAIVEPALRRKCIQLERDYETLPPVAVDKHQVLQILLNLLRNAEDAVDEAGKPEKLIHVRINHAGDGRVRIEVRDNGVGLARENLTRIFAHGFTTKPHGHGFGLHSGALAAKQMGGTLSAASDGPSQGAVFTLEIPLPATTVSAAMGMPSDRRSGDRPKADETGGEVTAHPYESTAGGSDPVPSPPQTAALSSVSSAGA